MNGIIGSLALLETTDSLERRGTLINVARQAADGLLQTLNEILDFAKLDAKGDSAINTAPIDVQRVCQVAVQTFQANAARQGDRTPIRPDALCRRPRQWFRATRKSCAGS